MYVCVCVCVYLYMYMSICKFICIFDILLIVCGCLCMHKHMRAQQTQMHVFFVMCFLTWGASADACSSRAQEPLPGRQRDQRTAVGRVRRARVAYVSARPRKRSASPLAPPARLSSVCTFSSRLFWTQRGQACACSYTFACMHACLCLCVCVCVLFCMHVCVSVC